jgi:hypothetical protein
MNNIEIAKLIKNKYRFVKQPLEHEISSILIKVKIDLSTYGTISEDKLRRIIFEVLKGKEVFIFDSAEMSSSVSILQQIIIAARKHDPK